MLGAAKGGRFRSVIGAYAPKTVAWHLPQARGKGSNRLPPHVNQSVPASF